MKKTIILLIICFLTINVFAQTKQDIYCNPDIVWAGIVDLDFIVDVDTNNIPDWKAYELSGFGDWFKQLTWDDNPQKKLNEIILENVETLQFYEYDSLKYKKHYQSLILSDPLIEPETYGDNGKPFPPSMFNVFRLKCLFYYDKSTLDFKIVPQAVGVLRPLYDVPSEVISYDILGWLPVEHLAKAIKSNDENSVLEFRFQRDVPFHAAKVFKQEWNDEEVMQSFIPTIRRKAMNGEVDLYDNFWGSLEKIDSEMLREMGREELMVARFDDFDAEPEYVEYSGEMYQGIRFSMNWFWNNETQSLSILTTDFSPLVLREDINGTVLGTMPLFLKKY